MENSATSILPRPPMILLKICVMEVTLIQLRRLFGMLIGITTNLSVDPNFDITPMLIQLFILFQGVQLIDNFVSQPIIYSNSIKAHPLEVFFVVLVFGNLAGVPGMIAAMPVYAFFRIIAKEFFSEAKIVRKMTQGLE